MPYTVKENVYRKHSSISLEEHIE